MSKKTDGPSSLQSNITRIYRPFSKISDILKKQYLTTSDIRQILPVTQRQLFYWDLKDTASSRKKTPKRSWRRFSVMDVLGFAIVSSLRLFGFELRRCKDVIEELSYLGLVSSIDFVYRFVEGESIFLLVYKRERKKTSESEVAKKSSVDFVDRLIRNVGKMYRKPKLDLEVRFQDVTPARGFRVYIPQPYIAISLDSLLRSVLRRIRTESYSVVFEENEKGKTRTVFSVDEESLRFNLTEEDKKRYLRIWQIRPTQPMVDL